MWDPFTNFTHAELPNGLQVHAAHWPDRSWQHVYVLVHSGAWHDLDGVEGTAHFMEHLVSENGANGMTAPEVEDFFRPYIPSNMLGLGATTYTATYYNFSVPAEVEVLAKALEIFGGMLITAKLEKCIERERKVVFGEFREYFPADYEYDLEVLKKQVFYPDNKLGRAPSALGTYESVEKITQADLQAFYDTHYTPKNMTIVTVGGMPTDEMLWLLLRTPFAANKPGQRSTPFEAIHVPPVPTMNRHVVDLRKLRSTGMTGGGLQVTATIPGSFSRSAMNIFSELLNDELMTRIRLERGWTYGAHSAAHWLCGFYEYEIDVGMLDPVAMHSIEEVVDECIRAVGRNEQKFLEQQRCSLSRLEMLDSPGIEVAEGSVQQLIARGHIATLADHRREIEAIRFEDMNILAALLRPERRYSQVSIP